MLRALDEQAWMENPSLSVTAVACVFNESQDWQTFLRDHAGNKGKNIDFCYTQNTFFGFEYHFLYSDNSTLSWPVVLLITETDGVKTIRCASEGAVAVEEFYKRLCNISEAFALNDGHEHSFEFVKTVEPTCAEQGYSLYRCDCGKEEHRDFVEPLGHSWVEATCAAPKTCSVCQKTEGAALKHEYQNDICIHCGEEMKGIMGDLDGNGKLSYNDALVILRGSIGLVKLDDTQKLLADVDGNGIVNYNDALTVLRRSIGLA